MTGYTYGGNDGALYGTSDGGLYATSGVIQEGRIDVRAKRQGSGTVDTDFYDANPIRDAFGRFSSGATLNFVDPDGTKVDSYPYGQRVDVEMSSDGGSTWQRRFTGFVADSTRSTKDGITQVEADMVSNDHLLRRRKVYKNYSSTTRSDILKDLIETFTSVTWVAGNVDVQNDDSIDFSMRGERVDEGIGAIASQSAGEDWGVNRDLEFFFRQQDVNRAPSINDGDVIDHDLPEDGKRAINRFKLFYGSSGGNFVLVEDRESQQNLKNKLNAPRRVVISDSDTITEITNEDEAEAVAKQRLDERSVIQTGELTLPLGRFDTESGDVVSLSLSDAGISDTDFRIAQIDYSFVEGTTTMTIAENIGPNLDDLLVNLSDSLSNARARDADPTATGTRYLSMQNGATVSLSTTIKTRTQGDGFVLGQSQFGKNSADKLGGQVSDTTTVSVNTQKVTRAFLNMARDVWQGESFSDNTHVGVGSDDTKAIVADNSLQNQIARRESDKYGAGNAAEKLEWIGSFGPGGDIADAADIEELMFFDAATGGDGYVRATLPATSIDASTKLTVRIEATVNVDTSKQGVVTAKGQERLRDLLIGETGHEPTDMVYGTGTTDATESDTSLGSQVHEDTINSTADGAVGKTDIIERIGSGEANGNDLSELGYENSANELLARVAFEALSKTSDFALETNYRFIASNA